MDGKEVRCSFNSCRNKFISIDTDRSYKAWARSKESRNDWGYDTKHKIQAKQYFWQCKEYIERPDQIVRLRDVG